jgi:hypothetical protein
MLHSPISYAYTTPANPSAFSGINNVERHFPNKKRAEINENLASINSYTLHREVKKVRTRNPFFIYVKRQQIQMDLIEMGNLARFNNGTRYLLVAIDCFTKKAWVVPMKNKTAKTTLDAIQQTLDDMHTLPRSIFFDRGREFVNKKVYPFLRRKRIRVLHPNSEIKAAIAERFNRSLQDIIYKYLTENETNNYIDVLSGLLSTYNNRGHRTLKFMSPNEAERNENKNFVVSALSDYYTKITSQQTRIKFKVGDIVRLYKYPTTFARGYQERFTRELFEVLSINTRMPIPTYTVKSCDEGDIIQGTFYSNELQKVTGGIFKVEKVLKKKVVNGKLRLFVKWQDFGSQHNSWIEEDDIDRVFQQ